MMLGMVWGMIPTAWRAGISIALVLALVGAVGGAYLYIRHQAYQDGYSAASVACERQKQEQAQANRAAISEAEKRLLNAADELSLKNMELDNAIEALSAAADADPNGLLDCLGVGGVQRLNEIR
ncbi:MAG TPA: hypothetical protein VN155_17050 [Devosia sp.]|nr:hypothetical protein [Devosia sp.]